MQDTLRRDTPCIGGREGLEATSLFRYRSGTPIDATTGADTSELLSGSRDNRPLERPGLPFLRNSFRNQGYQTIDARLLKSFALTEGARPQFSAEAFNLINFGNVQFLPSSLLLDNPAFNFGLGILPNGQTAPGNSPADSTRYTSVVLNETAGPGRAPVPADCSRCCIVISASKQLGVEP